MTVYRVHTQDTHSVILLHELAQQLPGPGWNRTLDAALLLVTRKAQAAVEELSHALGLTPPPQAAWLHSPLGGSKGCGDDQVRKLYELLQPYDVVGVQTFHGLFAGSHLLAGPLGLPCGGDACCTAFRNASDHVRKAPEIMAAAEAFVRQRLAGLQGFVAAHVRPYPDVCWRIWTHEGWQDQQVRGAWHGLGMRTGCAAKQANIRVDITTRGSPSPGCVPAGRLSTHVTHGTVSRYLGLPALQHPVRVQRATCCSCVPTQEKLEEFCDNAYLYDR